MKGFTWTKWIRATDSVRTPMAVFGFNFGEPGIKHWHEDEYGVKTDECTCIKTGDNVPEPTNQEVN